MTKKVYVVHCIDTEGPLYESIEATFSRLKEIFGVDLEPTVSNLKKIQNHIQFQNNYKNLPTLIS